MSEQNTNQPEKPAKGTGVLPQGKKPGGDTSAHPAVIIAITAGIFLFSQVMIAGTIGIYALLTGQGEEIFDTIFESNVNNFLITAGLVALQFYGVYLFLRTKGKTLRSIGLVKPVTKDIVRAGAGWLVYMVLFVLLVAVLQIIDTGIDFEQEQQLEFTRPDQRPELILIFASLVLAPAFIEEVLMRGFLFKGLRARLSFIQSTVLVSLIFGAAHLQIGTGESPLWAGFVDTFVLSVVLCWLTERYHSLWPAIYVHGIKNSIAFTYLFVL